MPEQRKKHLYLVFDDWNSGYSIRKVNLSGRSEQSSDSEEDSELPVFMRIQATRGYPSLFTSAFGTKIMALHSSAEIPTIDVQDHTISFETPPHGPLSPLYIPVSDEMLFALDLGTFEVLRKPESTEPSGPWMWQRVPQPPFPAAHVISYGVQPDGCILVSIRGGETFIFDTKKHVWKLCGNWVFPFNGHGHYDPSLEGFVGLSKEGYIYCCTMESTATIGDTGRTWLSHGHVKRTEEKVVCDKDPTGTKGHVSATFVHMGQGKFCLVECICTDDTATDEDDPRVRPRLRGHGVRPRFDGYACMGGGPQGGRFMYRVKTFSLSYDTGDLKLGNCEVCWYSLPREARIGSIRQNPVAFWL